MSLVRYEIRVSDILDERWSCWFEGMEILPFIENGERTGTLLYGCLPDQAAFFGVLSQVRNLNLTLVMFLRISEPSNVEKNNEK